MKHEISILTIFISLDPLIEFDLLKANQKLVFEKEN